MTLGLDHAQALRLFMKADAAAEALAAYPNPRSARLADSALSIGHTGGKWPGVFQIHAFATNECAPLPTFCACLVGVRRICEARIAQIQSHV